MLKVIDLKKSFKSSKGELEVIKGISFEIKEGEIVAIVGTSGSGKTSYNFV